MEFEEEVHSDGSNELIHFDDYVGGLEHLNTQAGFSSNTDLSNDVSYDFLSSDQSDLLVLTGESSNNTTTYEDNISAQINSFSLESENESESDPPDMDTNITIKDMAKLHILRYLPAKSLARCRLVSKEWGSWISTPFFAHTQSQYFGQTSGFFQDNEGTICFISLDDSSYGVPCPSLGFLPQTVFIKSSCNGLLLCQASDSENQYYVCNPANKEWTELPKSLYYHGEEPKNVLVFEPSSLNFESRYKIICPFSIPDAGPVLYSEIYDSNTKTWKTSDGIYFDENDLKSEGIFVNGVVYWETTRDELIAFDLKKEIYSDLKLPLGGAQKLPLGGALTKVNGELCYVKGYYCHSVKTCVLDVYGGESTMSFDVPFDGVEEGEIVDCRVLGNSCDDVVAFTLERSQGQNCLFAYHMKDGKLEGPLSVSNSIKLFSYVNSLVSISV